MELSYGNKCVNIFNRNVILAAQHVIASSTDLNYNINIFLPFPFSSRIDLFIQFYIAVVQIV